MLDQKTYDFIFSRCIRLCVDLLVPFGTTYLVGKRSHKPFLGKWALPGGGMHFGESVFDAANRIALKEFNCKIKSFSVVDTLEFPEEIESCGRHSISLVLKVILEPSSVPSLVNKDSFTEITPCNALNLNSEKMVVQHCRVIKKHLNFIPI
jgi:ADP-ribose pyrophosphatase YjhB (NUDIX family)